MEINYEFRKRLRQVHRASRVNPNFMPKSDECAICQDWAIVLTNDFAADKTLSTAAFDLQNYLQISMNVSVPISQESCGTREIRFKIDPEISDRPDGFLLHIEENLIRIAGQTAKGVFAGSIYLEDLMNLREAPFLTYGKTFCEPLIEARGVHSGFGLDDFPDHHLNAIAHAGFNEIYLFIRGIGKCANSYCDIQDLIDRAENYGLEVMFYSYIPGYKHPEDEDAEGYFEKSFGNIFKHYPKAKGIVIVGESAEFPSKDSATSGKRWNESLWHGIPDSRPSPGWWPCEDYPLWINAVKKAIQKYKPDAKIAFSTYNWLWAPAEERRKFLETFPKDVQILVPFEMFKSHQLKNIAYQQVMDYTISETNFSECCREEMEMAHELGLNIGVTSMTAGTPWNFGTAPYVPVPLQWIKKFRTLQDAKKKYGIDNFYDSHHMGWWPSIVTDLARAAFRQPETDMEVLLRKLTIRDYGEKAANTIMEVWRLWSEAITFYVPSNENQYGPYRIGPSYPFVFHPNITRTMDSKEIKFPTMENSYAGSNWVKTFFQPFENLQQSPYSLRRKPEMEKQTKMLKFWQDGVNKLIGAKELIPKNKSDIYNELVNLGRFIECFMITGININKWYQLNLQLLNSEKQSESLQLLNEIESLAENELINAKNAITFVDADSRLGWEPSMEYMTDRWHLEWKIKQIRTMIDGDIAAFRNALEI